MIEIPRTPEEFAQIKRLAVKKIESIFDLAKTKLGINLSIAKITFDLKGKIAGTADYQRNWIRLNPFFLFKYPEDFINNRTITHECGHIFAIHKFIVLQGKKIQSHGREWKETSVALGLINTTPRHDYDLIAIPKYAAQAARRKTMIRNAFSQVKTIPNGKIINFD